MFSWLHPFLAVVLITCMHNFMTRLADGLGVNVDDKFVKAIDSWVTGPLDNGL